MKIKANIYWGNDDFEIEVEDNEKLRDIQGAVILDIKKVKE